MRTRRNKGGDSEPLAEPMTYSWCLICKGKKKTGLYTDGKLRQHYSKKHRIHDVPSRSWHDALTSLLEEVEKGATEGPPEAVGPEQDAVSSSSSEQLISSEEEVAAPSSSSEPLISSEEEDAAHAPSPSHEVEMREPIVVRILPMQQAGTSQGDNDKSTEGLEEQVQQEETPGPSIQRDETTKRETLRCKKCELEAESPELLQKHVDVVHDLIMEFMCDHCEFVTGYTAELEAHTKQVHGEEEERLRDAVDGAINMLEEEPDISGPEAEVSPVEVSPEPQSESVHEVLDLKPTGTPTNEDEHMEEEEELEVYRGVDHKDLSAHTKLAHGEEEDGMRDAVDKTLEEEPDTSGPVAEAELSPVDVSPEPQSKSDYLKVLKLKPTGVSDEANDMLTKLLCKHCEFVSTYIPDLVAHIQLVHNEEEGVKGDEVHFGSEPTGDSDNNDKLTEIVIEGEPVTSGPIAETDLPLVNTSQEPQRPLIGDSAGATCILAEEVEHDEEEMEVYRGVPEYQYNAWPDRSGRLKYLCYGCFVWFNDKFSIDRHFYLRHLCDEQKWPEDFPPLKRYN